MTRLVSVSFERVELGVLLETGEQRIVSVHVAGGRDWFAATRFPHFHADTGETTGDELLDLEIRVRAAEELVRLAAAVEAIAARRAA